jgi:hypothetical protein
MYVGGRVPDSDAARFFAVGGGSDVGVPVPRNLCESVRGCVPDTVVEVRPGTRDAVGSWPARLQSCPVFVPLRND